jgi:hypothetical protein
MKGSAAQDSQFCFYFDLFNQYSRDKIPGQLSIFPLPSPQTEPVLPTVRIHPPPIHSLSPAPRTHGTNRASGLRAHLSPSRARERPRLSSFLPTRISCDFCRVPRRVSGAHRASSADEIVTATSSPRFGVLPAATCFQVRSRRRSRKNVTLYQPKTSGGAALKRPSDVHTPLEISGEQKYLKSISNLICQYLSMIQIWHAYVEALRLRLYNSSTDIVGKPRGSFNNLVGSSGGSKELKLREHHRLHCHIIPFLLLQATKCPNSQPNQVDFGDILSPVKEL